MLLLTTGCKLAPVQSTNVVIICRLWRLHEVFQENKLRLNQCSVNLHLLFTSELKVFTGVQKRSISVAKVGVTHA